MADTTEDEQQVPHLRILELLPIAVKSRVFLLRYTILDFLSMIFRSQFLMKTSVGFELRPGLDALPF